MSIPETRSAASPNAWPSVTSVVGCDDVGLVSDGTKGLPEIAVSALTLALRSSDLFGAYEKRAVSPLARLIPGRDRALTSALNDNPNRLTHPLIVVAGTTTPFPLMLDRHPSTPAPNCSPRVDPDVPTCKRSAELALANASSDA
jgi:hypothetical protein